MTTLQLDTACGTCLRPNSAFRIFIDKARTGQPITIQGDGSRGRQSAYATDVATAFDLACRSEVHGVAPKTVAAETTSINELAELVVDRYPTEMTFGDPRPGDVHPEQVNPALAEETLDWRATTAFDMGPQHLPEDRD